MPAHQQDGTVLVACFVGSWYEETQIYWILGDAKAVSIYIKLVMHKNLSSCLPVGAVWGQNRYSSELVEFQTTISAPDGRLIQAESIGESLAYCQQKKVKITSLEPVVAVPLPKEEEEHKEKEKEEEEEEVAPLSPKTTQTPETVAVIISPPSSPTLDFDDLVQQIEPLDGIDPLLSDIIDPLAWDLGDGGDTDSLVLDDEELAALWNIGDEQEQQESNQNKTIISSLEEPRQPPAIPTEEEEEEVPETKSEVVEVEPKTTISSDPQEEESKEVASEETKIEDSQEETEEKNKVVVKEDASDQQQNEEEEKKGTDGLPSYLYCKPCEPISPSAQGGETLSPQLLQTLEQTPQLSREELLEELAGLDLGSLAQLALSMDNLEGSAQDELLSILEEATGIKETEQNLFDFEGEGLLEELNELGFGGLAEIGPETLNEPALVSEPSTPTIEPVLSTDSTHKEEKEAKPVTPSNEKGNEDENPGNTEDMPLRLPDNPVPESAPRIVELENEDEDENDKTGKPKARHSDSPSKPGKKPRPITSGTNDSEQEKIDKESGTPLSNASSQEDLDNDENREAQSKGSGSGSKNESFLARLRENQAEAKRKDEEEFQQRSPLHVTDTFRGCMPCLPRNFRIITTKKPKATFIDTSAQAPVENSSEKKSPPPIQNNNDDDSITTGTTHPQLQDSTGESNDTSDPPAQHSQEQQQREQQQQQNDGHEEEGAGDYNPARPEAWDLAADLLDSFGLMEGSKKKEQSCFGHKEKIFGVSFSECGNFCASASQDATINIWDVKKNALLASLKGHSRDYECLRVVWASSTWSSDSLDRTSNFQYLLASSGADGTVRFWACKDPRIKQGREGCWTCCLKFDHAELRNRQSEVGKKLGSISEDKEAEEEKEQDKPQVYSLQFIDHWQAFNNEMGTGTKNAFFMTSSDDYVHFWELDIRSGMEQVLTMGEDQEISLQLRPDEMGLKEVFSLHFGNMKQYYYGVQMVNVTEQGFRVGVADSTERPVRKFGGERNPDNLVYVFDASYCPTNGLLGVALSDGSLRLQNGRGHCVSVMNLPGVNSHLTSFDWDRSGERLVTTVATGHLITWHVHMGDVQGNGNAKAECMAIMEGGHQPGRPLFGAKYLGGEHEHLILSWGIDGSLCLWDSYLQGNVNVPMAVLRRDDQYPIYAVDVHRESKVIAVAGGTDGGFIGTPLYLYNYEQVDVEERGKASSEKKGSDSKTEAA